MRVLHVDSGRDWRGGQAQALHLAAGLAGRGFTQIVAAPEGSPLIDRCRAQGLDTAPIGVRGDLDARAVLKLRALMNRFRPELVHAHTAHAHAAAVAAARLAGVPRRVVTRRMELGVGGHPLSRLKYRRGVSAYVAISRRVAESLIAGGVDPQRVWVVYSGVDADIDVGALGGDARSRARAALGLPAEAPVLGCVGALTREKGQDLAVGALAKLGPEARLVLFGDGPERDRLVGLAARLGVAERVILAGHRSDMARMWPALDLALAPSRHEGLGTAVIEALGAGVPVVAARVGGIPEVVEDGVCGTLVCAGDVEALSRAAAVLLDDPERRRCFAEAGRRRARRFSVDAMVGGTIEVYRGLDRTGVARALGRREER